MNIIVCIDDRNGMLFAGRRVSSDKAVTERIAAIAKENRIWLNSYSAKLFEDCKGINVDERFLDKAESSDYCFVENTDVSNYKDKIESLTVYRWNRKYPSDFKFPLEGIISDMKLASREDFKGNSHDKVTREVYRCEK